MTQSVQYQQYQIKCTSVGKGEILVFLHGWPTNSNLWNYQIELLKNRYRIISFDWLGFGQSDKPGDHEYTFTKKKEILDAVLSGLLKNKEQVSLIAHDVGGPPAILWASENQERVKRLILLNTVIFPFSTFTDRISHYFFGVPIIKKIIVSDFGLKVLMKTLTRSGRETINNSIIEILDAHENWEKDIRLKTILEPLKAGKKNELQHLAGRFKGLAVEKYLIIAKDDPLCYKHMERLREENPDIPAFFIEHCGHFIPIDQGDKLNEILTKVLEPNQPG